jgi:transcriptional regulator with XRE-family HTH domain
MSETVYTWGDGIPIECMRIQPHRRLYAYERIDGNFLIFKVVPKGGYQGSAKMLKTYRVKHGFNQTKASEILGVSQASIAKYENNRKLMPLRVILKIEFLNGVLEEGRFPDFKPSKTDKDKTGSFFKYLDKTCRHKMVFRLIVGELIFSMRIVALGKYYGFSYYKGDEIGFESFRKPANQKQKLSSLIDFRKKNGWTQAEFGKLLDVSQSMIAKWESGGSFFPNWKAEQIIKLLRSGVAPEKILRYHEDQIDQWHEWLRNKKEKTATLKQNPAE